MFSSENFLRHSHEYGDIVVSCPVHISKGIRQKENALVLQYSCALLNSGGGVLEMKNIDYQHTHSKSLDAWWSGMENNLAGILSSDDICNYFDFVGNFDDEFLYLFVKSSEHLCTVDYNCRLPTDTATHCVTYKSAVKICSTTGGSKPMSSLPTIPSSFVYGQTDETLKQEGKQIQFKFLTSDSDYTKKALADKVSFYCTRYISAFANHEGGHIYFGIEDTTSAVLGEEMTENDELKCTKAVESKMKVIIWGDERFAALKGVHWDIKFVPVTSCPNQHQRKVVVISVCRMFGGVFTSCPESYFITQTQTTTANEPHYGLRRLSFDEWKTELLNQNRDVKSLHSRYIKIPLRTPQCRLVFSLPHTLQAAREKVIKLSTGLSLHPKNILQSFSEENVKKAVTKLVGTFSEEPHLIISLECWGLELELPEKPLNVKACLAIFSSLYGLHVVSLVSDTSNEQELWSFTSQLAIRLKKVLVQHGGCTSHLGFKVHIIDINAPLMLELFQGSIDIDIYPQTYKLTEDSLSEIVTALTIAVASYKNFGVDDKADGDHYFLLTCDQLELLWCHQFTRELWIHGPPGSGKTVAALEIIKEFRRRGCQKDDVLYVAENSLLCSLVSSLDNCLVVSRRELMADSQDGTVVTSKYGRVRNVVVDEAQNFKDRDGNWYSLLEKLSQQNLPDRKCNTAGYFWLFMDYAQKVHKFEAGLPGLIGKNNFMLREISRNSKEIYEYATKFMEDSNETPSKNGVAVSPQLGHEFSSGNDVSVVKCEKSSMQDMLYKVLKQFTDQGIDLSNMAILVSKKSEAEEVMQSVSESCMLGYVPSLNAPSTEAGLGGLPQGGASGSLTQGGSSVQSRLTVSTVREFSGLDKPVVIGLDPHTNEDHADLNKFLLNLVTRAKDSLVILTTSDKVLQKLKA